MALNPSNSSNLEYLLLKGLTFGANHFEDGWFSAILGFEMVVVALTANEIEKRDT